MTYTANAAEISQLRRLTGEYPSQTSDYKDGELAEAIENRNGDLHAAAYDVWTWKAAAVSSLIDWSADGGNYKQGELYERYKANALAEWHQSSLCTMIIDPTLKPVEE